MKKIFLGHIITMNKNQPEAEAIVTVNNYIVYVGSKEFAKKWFADAEIIDYSKYYIYPGFMEPHCHPTLAGDRLKFQIDLSGCNSFKECAETVKKYMKQNPQQTIYKGAGWGADLGEPTAAILDPFSKETPIVLNDEGGHAMWLNSAAMSVFNIDKTAAKKHGGDCVKVDKDGNPTGMIAESVTSPILTKLFPIGKDLEEALLEWQSFALSKGYTAVADASVMYNPKLLKSYINLAKSGELKLRTRGMIIVNDVINNPQKFIKECKDYISPLENDYFKINSIKVFIDGVIEAHTAWLSEGYTDAPNDKGIQRFHDINKLQAFIKEAANNGWASHFHCIGDAATSFALKAINSNTKLLKEKNIRCEIAHLQLVNRDDITKFSVANTIAVVPPLWAPNGPDNYFEQETQYIGADRANGSYPIKSFIDNNAMILFHSDYPCSKEIDIPSTLYAAVTRNLPKKGFTAVGKEEAITMQEALEAMTINVAKAWKEDNTLGSIEQGKIANFTVFDKNFLTCKKSDICKTKLIDTIIDSKSVL